MSSNHYSLSLDLPDVDQDEALERVVSQLEQEGFGILTEIDVRETLRQKLGVEYPRYVILGACHPDLAHRALAAELGIGVMLPCNVVVTERQGGGASVLAIDPTSMLDVVDNPHFAPVAQEVKRRLQRVLHGLVPEESRAASM